MKFDAALMVDTQHLGDAARIAQSAEQIGFDGLWTQETQHNPFLPLALAAPPTRRIELGTGVAIAFPRSPMVTAQTAWDLQALSGGRFVLGLGTQVKPHIERRFGMTWEAPVAKLRDYVQALRAIWGSWQSGGRLSYRGQFYEHTLMTPFFSPGPIQHPHIPIYIAGVNEGLAHLAGEICDGFHVHPFHSIAYLEQIVRPQVAAGAAQAGRTLADIAMTSSIFVITGPDRAAMDSMRQAVRQQLAFYASTPTYRVVLECHGWAEVGQRLSGLAKDGDWEAMGRLIGDEMLEVFAVEAPLDRLGAAVKQRYRGILDRVALYLPYQPGELDDAWRAIAREIHAD
jgi:probable F420-dependent oxidoreductase